MRFRGLVVAGFAMLILLTLLLTTPHSTEYHLLLSISFAAVICLQLVILLLNDEFTGVHVFTTLVLFFSLAGLVIGLMSGPSITSVFLATMFILAYLLTIFLVLVHDWKRYSMFDRMLIAAERRSKVAEQRKHELFVPVEEILEEPPHFWVETDGTAHIVPRAKSSKKKRSSVKKSTKKVTSPKTSARKNISRPTSRKKSARKSSKK